MRYRSCYPVAALTLALSLFAPASVLAQTAHIVASQEAAPALRGHLLHEAIDPCLGKRWQWIADPLHPEWPSRLVLADSDRESQKAAPASESVAPSQRTQPTSFAPVIRAGEIVTVRQETGAVRAQLQALALEAARTGQPLRVRLLVTSDRSAGMNFVLTSAGPVVTVVATARGEAQWPGSPVRPIEETGR